jgi:hypothetical protein
MREGCFADNAHQPKKGMCGQRTRNLHESTVTVRTACKLFLIRLILPSVCTPKMNATYNLPHAGVLTLPFTLRNLPLAVTLALLGGGPAQAVAQQEWVGGALSASGYTGAINTPLADVIPWGGLSVGLTNSNPELGRRINAGGFGSINAGLGLLPGLELVGRLAFEGDLQCSMYSSSPCRAGQRDLSVSGKYQLPLDLPLNTRLALGFTDYGGAATQYRQVYGVATSTLGPLDLSLGYGMPKSRNALLDGAFGSANVRISNHVNGMLEYDSREARTGVLYLQPLTRQTNLQLGVSRKLTQATEQQRWQWSAALNIALGQPHESLPVAAEYAASMRTQPKFYKLAEGGAAVAAPVAQASRPDMTVRTEEAIPSSSVTSTPVLDAQAFVQLLQEQGFAHVHVRHWTMESAGSARWEVRAEPRRWRQSQIDAVAVVLAQWLKRIDKASGDELALTLTYQQMPVLAVQTRASCLSDWLKGAGVCRNGFNETSGAVRIGRAAAAPEDGVSPPRGTGVDEAHGEGGPVWAPQFEIGPSLRTTVGTEYGLADYSLALEIGAEVALAPGLFWQGTYQVPVSHSADFGEGGVFESNRHPSAGFDTGMLSYWRRFSSGVDAQLSGGYVNRRYLGGQLDAFWMNEDGRWRVSGTVGRYNHETRNVTQTPVLAEVRYNLVPGLWNVEATAGRFLGGDQGYRLATTHWFDDKQVQLFYRASKGDSGTALGQRINALGFTVNLPLGPKEAVAAGATTVRGNDRWGWGLQTKVGGQDNALPMGYGEVPRVRHGVMTDVSDHDRNGVLDLQARMKSLKAGILDQLAR